MSYMDIADQIIKQYSKVEFSWDMSLGDFFKWILDLPLYGVFFVFILLLSIWILIKAVIHDLKNNKK